MLCHNLQTDQVREVLYEQPLMYEILTFNSLILGGAGVVGALSYASLTAVFNIRETLQIMLIMPFLTAVT